MGVQNVDMTMTSYNQLDEDWRFPQMKNTFLKLKGLQNYSLSKLVQICRVQDSNLGLFGP